MKLALRVAAPLLVVAVGAYALISSLDGEAARPQMPTVVQRTGKLVAPGTPKAKPQRKPTTVVVVMDEFPVDLLLDARGQINAQRYPNFAALARTGTWFKNASSVYDSTTKAVPAILDGRLPRKGSVPNFKGHPRSIFDLFGRRGYRIVKSEVATSICPPRYCKGAKLSRPAILPLLKQGRRADFERFVSRIGPSRRPTLYLKHVLLPHGPFLFLPSGKQSRAGFRDPLPGMASVPGFYDTYLTQHNEQRVREQLGFADRELGKLFARMDRAGILDKSLLVVTADHGISSEVNVANRRVVSRSNIDEVAPVPLFVKAPGQRRGRVAGSYAKTIDVLPTIADVLGFKLGQKVDGRSAFSRAVRRRRSVTMIKRDFSGRITLTASVMQRRRAANRRRNDRLYGTGGWASLYTNIGPNRGLLGKSVRSIRPGGRAPVTGSIAVTNYLRDVRGASVVLPNQIAGRMRGGGNGRRRDLAVAVNGRIEAVGHSVYLKDDKVESFAINVPERAIRDGRNDVRLYEVDGGRRLRLIARD